MLSESVLFFLQEVCCFFGRFRSPHRLVLQWTILSPFWLAPFRYKLCAITLIISLAALSRLVLAIWLVCSLKAWTVMFVTI